MSVIDYTTLNSSLVQLVPEHNLFRIYHSDEQWVEGPNAIDLRVCLQEGSSIPTFRVGWSNPLACSCQTDTPAEQQLINFLFLLTHAALAGTLPQLLNVVARFLGDEATLSMQVEGLCFVWNETEFDWTFPTGNPTQRAANDTLFCLERAALGTVMHILHRLLVEPEPAFITAFAWFCKQQIDLALKDAVVETPNPRSHLRLIIPEEDAP